MCNSVSTIFAIDKRNSPWPISLQQSCHFFSKLLPNVGVENFYFAFQKITLTVNTCGFNTEIDSFNIGEFWIFLYL